MRLAARAVRKILMRRRSLFFHEVAMTKPEEFSRLEGIGSRLVCDLECTSGNGFDVQGGLEARACIDADGLLRRAIIS